jgi:hypothetical protein
MRFPKHDYIRSKTLLRNAREIPCQHCGADDGTVVAAHSNQLIHGKGRGLKASDQYIASLCFQCHANLDSGSTMSKSERMEMWQAAHKKTVEKLTKLGLWPADVPIPEN